PHPLSSTLYPYTTLFRSFLKLTMKATYKKYILNFKQASGTSRGVLKTKETWFLILEQDGKIGVGECGLFRGLSADDVSNYEEILDRKSTRLNSSHVKISY